MLLSLTEHYLRQQRLTAAGVLAAQRMTSMSLTQIAQIVTMYQLAVAREAIDSMTAMIEEQGLIPDPQGAVAATALVGFSPDGRRLESLFTQAETDAQFALIVANTLQGTARTAGAVAMSNDYAVDGFMRVMNPPSCRRCAVLAGKWFKYEADFDRHPRCDCTQVPCNRADWGDLRTEMGSMSSAQQAYEDGLLMRSRTYVRADGTEVTRVVEDLTKAQQQAIDLGADFNQVVNTNRDPLRTAGTNIGGYEFKGAEALRITREGTTVRGIAGSAMNASFAKPVGERYRRSTRYRITPWSIFKVADTRDEQIRLLKLYGYIL